MARADQVQLFGLPELVETLERTMPREARNIQRRTVTRVAAMVRKDVRERAPVGATGNLKRSIKSRRRRGQSRDEAEAAVYVDRSGGRSGRGYHWHLLEFGTINMPAQPFFRPAVIAIEPRIPSIFRREFGVQLEKEMAKRARRARVR